ncbi:multicopper oxidase domain-containing protein [Pseudomonas sp. Fl5BN2]|uniref:multicopper oxidase family protein n=1 Tax=Pseudomonas sp. Fl5BN2 TaxID=2697652 RepID=UPI001377A78B|nr:multicopper oxidase domain-containing protein [Pseudomonas sp. Fl5BN2]NBF01714.1 multicopper oxidase domain-containing protein [Pseudomonas sp. Fl5BN2]
MKVTLPITAYGGCILLSVACSIPPVAAEEVTRIFENPSSLEQQVPEQETTETTQLMSSKATTLSPLALPPHGGTERALVLNIDYTQSTLFDPATGRKVPVRLRSYRGTGVNPLAPFVAPTINVTPGDTVRITLNNKLKPKDEQPCNAHSGEPDKPQCFNSTNLHSHGLWVSPAGNSDNVMLSINPGVSFQYEYNIPADHPAGTFWYHPHRHGSTALQVASGMAGALIIRGSRLPGKRANGDLDTLLKSADGKAFPERLLVLQQIPYACKGVKTDPVTGDKSVNWNCDAGEVGVVEDFAQFTPQSWGQSGRYTSINGLVQPIFRKARAGQVERWRLVHAGIRDTIKLEFRKLADSGLQKSNAGVAAVDADAFVSQQCVGEPVDYQVVAADGLTLGKAQKLSQVTLQPGYRNDLLMVFPQTGRYCVVDAAQSADGGVAQAASGRQILGFVDVVGGTEVKDTSAYLTQLLVDSARRNMPDSVQNQIIGDLNNGLLLTKFVPHKSIGDDEVKGRPVESLMFFINRDDKKNPKFEVGTSMDDVKPYEPGKINRHLTLGTAQTWMLSSGFASHPFHIHVNPFQVEKIIGPDGTDLSEPGAIDKTDPDDKQYAGLKGVWKDTLFVKGPDKDGRRYTLYVRTRYERYIGEFVLHCHILDHEDQGMMQNVSIELSDGQGGTAPMHH